MKRLHYGSPFVSQGNYKKQEPDGTSYETNLMMFSDVNAQDKYDHADYYKFMYDRTLYENSDSEDDDDDHPFNSNDKRMCI